MKKLSHIFQEYGVLVALLLLVIINAATRPEFVQIENIRNILSQGAYIGIIAVGMTYVILTGGIDLSVGSLVALCGAVCILALNKLGTVTSANSAILVACLASIGIGITAGFFNGLVITKGRVVPFIVTLAGLAAFRSLALYLGQGGEIRSTVPSFRDFGFGGVPIPGAVNPSGQAVVLYWSLLIFIVVAVIAEFALRRTRFGRHVVAVGSNERASRYSAISTDRVKIGAYVLLGGLVGLAACLNAARMNSVGTGSVGLFYELDAIAAVVIGGTSLKGGKGRIWGTVVGVILLTVIANMMTAYRIDTNLQGLVRGAVILIAVLLQRDRNANER